jgi:hypothetical protein
MKTVHRRRTQHDQHQAALPGIDPSAVLRTYQQASGVVGEFFELLTARMVDGYRQGVSNLMGENPDVVAGDRNYESKAAGRGRWLLEATQTRAFAKDPKGRYVLWSYTTPPPGGLVQFGTVRQLHEWLAANITGCFVIPSHYPLLMLAGTEHEEPRQSEKAGRFWGCNYWFRSKYLHSVLARERSIDAEFAIRTWPTRAHFLAGVARIDFMTTWMIDLPDDITPLDQALAREALRDLDEKRHQVDLIPCDRGPGKKRIVVSRNPDWYRAFIQRRQIPTRWRDRDRQMMPKNPRTSGRRQHVRRALERIRDNTPNPQRRWIGWELIEILRDHDARGRE